MAKTSLISQPRWWHLAVFFGPLAATYAVFYLFSIYFLAETSFKKVSLSLSNGTWVGWRNYRLLFSDPAFLIALKNNLVFAGVSIAAGLTLGFMIAVSLSTGVRHKAYYYTVFLLPSLMPLALVATVFRNLLESHFGPLNTLLRAAGLDALALDWLIDPTLAYASVCSILVYLIGLPLLYYTANLSTINTSLLEAAVLDGAKTPRLLWEILFPLMKGTHRTIILSTLLSSFRAFDVVFFSTRGGPAGATEITGTYVYRFSTTGTNLGYASAAALFVMAVSLVISVLQLISQRLAK